MLARTAYFGIQYKDHMHKHKIANQTILQFFIIFNKCAACYVVKLNAVKSRLQQGATGTLSGCKDI